MSVQWTDQEPTIKGSWVPLPQDPQISTGEVTGSWVHFYANLFQAIKADDGKVVVKIVLNYATGDNYQSASVEYFAEIQNEAEPSPHYVLASSGGYYNYQKKNIYAIFDNSQQGDSIDIRVCGTIWGGTNRTTYAHLDSIGPISSGSIYDCDENGQWVLCEAVKTMDDSDWGNSIGVYVHNGTEWEGT